MMSYICLSPVHSSARLDLTVFGGALDSRRDTSRMKLDSCVHTDTAVQFETRRRIARARSFRRLLEPNSESSVCARSERNSMPS